MAVIQKTYSTEIKDGLEFVLSDETVDREGDVIKADGWDLQNFRKNPIALFGHNGGFPIGVWENVRVEGNKLLGRLRFAAEGTSDRIDELRRLVEQGILKTVSVGFRPSEMEPREDGRGFTFTRQELLETSLVSVPANPAALALAKSLNLSQATMDIAFGEQADDGARPPAIHKGVQARNTVSVKENKMPTISQRIEHAQFDLEAKRQRLAELNEEEVLDLDAIEAVSEEIDKIERTLTALRTSEAKLAGGATTAAPNLPTPASAGQEKGMASPSIRRPIGLPVKEPKPWELLVRSAVVRGCAHFSEKSIDKILDERYPGHEATAVVAKADATIGTTGVSGWASEIVHTAYADFLDALMGVAIYPTLRDRGIGLSFDGRGTVKIPSRTAGGANGSFVSEGSPIRVGRITTAEVEMTSRKMGVIVPFSRELAKQSTPMIEGLVRQAILEDTASVLDSAVLDATAGDTTRPAGLLNGVSAAASGYGGGDYKAVLEDINALLAPFDTANAADGITLIMHPQQARKLSMMEGPEGTGFGWAEPFMSQLRPVVSTYATAGRLIAIRNTDFATALGDAPEFDISESATIHMEDTTPLEIVSGTGPATADPVRSLWQTATIGVRMLMDVSWKMRRSGMVQWIDGTSW